MLISTLSTHFNKLVSSYFNVFQRTISTFFKQFFGLNCVEICINISTLFWSVSLMLHGLWHPVLIHYIRHYMLLKSLKPIHAPDSITSITWPNTCPRFHYMLSVFIIVNLFTLTASTWNWYLGAAPHKQDSSAQVCSLFREKSSWADPETVTTLRQASAKGLRHFGAASMKEARLVWKKQALSATSKRSKLWD